MPTSSPFVLVTPGPHGLAVSGANAPALAQGVHLGATLADVRAMHPGIGVHPGEPAQDAAALDSLALWLGRYGPHRHTDGADGAWIDVTGVPHLFGGEGPLARDLCDRLGRIGITARVGLADTLGAAHALARFRARPIAIAPPGRTADALAPLPVEALRLAPATVQLLERLGLRRIGQLYRLPREALERRFREAAKSAAATARGTTAHVLLRLDQALGDRSEPQQALDEPPDTTERLPFAEPLISNDGITQALERLAARLVHRLSGLELTARHFRLALYRVDGSVAEIEAGTSGGCRDAAHICRLMTERLANIDAGFGIDLATLAAGRIERFEATATTLDAAVDRTGRQDPGPLIDRLANRLGGDRVRTPVRRASHIPERQGALVSLLQTAAASTDATARRSSSPAVSLRAPAPIDTPHPLALHADRPPLLLPRPEPIDVMAEVPEGAPLRVVWRRVPRRIVRAEGPERIAPEWWGDLARPMLVGARTATRDYYRLEDDTGAGYWVFREGLYSPGDEEDDEDEPKPPRWFMHGLLA